MKQFFLCFSFCAACIFAIAQTVDCSFKAPVITIDFGDDQSPRDLSLSQLKDNYRHVSNYCPNDGEFTFTSHTKDCYMGNWLTFTKDHTPGSVNGRMMIINAAYTPATFFAITLTALKPATTYELSAWMVNVCPGREGCEPTPPDVRISVYADGKLASRFYTGAIPPAETATWRRYAGTFTTPAAFSGIVVAMDDITTGGCGNDFAMDDIEVRECIIKTPPPPPTPKPQPVVVNKPVEKKPVPKPVVKQPEKPVQPVISKKETAIVKNVPVNTPAAAGKPAIKPVVTTIPVPEVIKTRENTVFKKIESPESDITIELYDNGEIDGDTVTIYHNNKMVVSHAGLSTKPVTVKIKVNEAQPHHELVMVADNLGSIPPNTSLMVITTKYKRHEVFISSTEQKNAKVLIDLQKE